MSQIIFAILALVTYIVSCHDDLTYDGKDPESQEEAVVKWKLGAAFWLMFYGTVLKVINFISHSFIPSPEECHQDDYRRHPDLEGEEGGEDKNEAVELEVSGTNKTAAAEDVDDEQVEQDTTKVKKSRADDGGAAISKRSPHHDDESREEADTPTNNTGGAKE